MPAEVYSTIKSAVPYRAWLIASFLLLLASALAGDMVYRGSGSWTAGNLVQPQGWEMAFRPPSQFEEVDPDPKQFGTTYLFRYRDHYGRLIELTYWRLRAGDASAVKVARVILEQSKSWFSLLLGPSPTRTVGRLGTRDALEVVDPAIPMILRALVSESEWAYAVAIRVEGGPIDKSIYTLFDLTCRSVKFLTPAV
ncbi:hypothetical protein [Nitrospira sp. BLG_2]|uniref:hypothetical protein n=1 Tax=Nitrospira sp. BLG_2 TaxID=3397507 RepID=UPI003B9C4249